MAASAARRTSSPTSSTAALRRILSSISSTTPTRESKRCLPCRVGPLFSPMARFHSFADVFTTPTRFLSLPSQPLLTLPLLSLAIGMAIPYLPVLVSYNSLLPRCQNGSGGQSGQGGVRGGGQAKDGASGQLLRPIPCRPSGSCHGHRDPFPARHPAQFGVGGSSRRLSSRRGRLSAPRTTLVDSIPYRFFFFLI